MRTGILEPVEKAEAEKAVRTLIRYLGDDPERKGLEETPARVLKSYLELFSGYEDDASRHLAKNFQEDTKVYNGIVLMQDIDFISWCEHHMLPFQGVAHVAYLADAHLVGASKLARVVEVFARRLQVQERMTQQIADAIENGIDPHPKGVAVIVQAHHSCMSCRGVRQQNSIMSTNVMHGVFREDAATRAELMATIQLGRGLRV